ncbi:methyltransferase [Candidatus Bathyarchaeota archaeon]|nr:methyltransferase [Candidatus Bathyarchaeota archaeon]
MDLVYNPAEDSYLLQKYVEKLVYGNVINIGTGTGVQALTAARKNEVSKVVATDISINAISVVKELVERNGFSDKVTIIESDLFNNIYEKFDWIIFNAPYLPSEKALVDSTFDGGKTGKEVIERFLIQATNFLKENGRILLIYSSETGITESYGYKWIILEELHIFFESIFCAMLEPY